MNAAERIKDALATLHSHTYGPDAVVDQIHEQAQSDLAALAAELVRTREALAIAGPILEVIGDWLVSQQPPMPSEVEAELMRWCAESERFLRLAAAGSDGETSDG